jgi:hypothetical protein
MIYSEDSSENGKKCQITIKDKVIDCVVICSFKRTINGNLSSEKYIIQDNEGNIYNNISKSLITFKK